MILRLVASTLVAVAGLTGGYVAADQWSPFRPAETAAVAAAVMTRPVASSTPVPSASSAPVASPSPSFDLAARSIDDPDSTWVVVNKVRPIEAAYSPSDLERVEGVAGGVTMRAEAAAALAALQAAAAAEGAGFAASTAYRDHAQQRDIYESYVRESGEAAADRFSARPGFSEHQTGLSVDIHADSCDLHVCFGDTAAGRYVAEHGWEHGFIVRYPEGAEAVTGYIYEPWHLRYVGVELAAEMHERGVVTMEELFGLAPAPDYS